MNLDATDDLSKGRVDLVPMIDCIMLLLIFFVMTTRFQPPEGTISSLLPTTSGGCDRTVREPLKQVNICIYPADPLLVPGVQPSLCTAALSRISQHGTLTVLPAAYVRIGAREPLRVVGADLAAPKGSAALAAALAAVHQRIADELALYEVAGRTRSDQPDVVIHGFSGLPWAFTLTVLDAVRAYESAAAGMEWTGDPRQLETTRAISLAPPRIRNYVPDELGQELYELVQLH